jgi:hypothetical protein
VLVIRESLVRDDYVLLKAVQSQHADYSKEMADLHARSRKHTQAWCYAAFEESAACFARSQANRTGLGAVHPTRLPEVYYQLYCEFEHSVAHVLSAWRATKGTAAVSAGVGGVRARPCRMVSTRQEVRGTDLRHEVGGEVDELPECVRRTYVEAARKTEEAAEVTASTDVVPGVWPERLDVFNGLLMAPQVDALFDGGWISFAGSGVVVVSPILPLEAAARLGLSAVWRVANLSDVHRHYMAYHRLHVLRG